MNTEKQGAVMSLHERQVWLSSVIQGDDATPGERLRACDQLNRMDGAYIQRVEADVKREVVVNIELTDEDT